MQDFLLDHGEIIGYIGTVIIFGIGIIASLLDQYKHSSKLRDPKYRRTVGDIVDFKMEETKNRRRGTTITLYYAIIEFEDEQGKKYRYVSKNGMPTSDRKNTRVPICYNVDDPTDCVAQFYYNGYFAAVAFLVLAILFCLLIHQVANNGL